MQRDGFAPTVPNQQQVIRSPSLFNARRCLRTASVFKGLKTLQKNGYRTARPGGRAPGSQQNSHAHSYQPFVYATLSF
jgi:hypothetical protein